ncbi:hypothetical protein BSKO_10968 [Bryopsis sp. KO-2023]|nr:hypothetical protein BSKO_10968 [Bryopsis sp. KO-2023]
MEGAGFQFPFFYDYPPYFTLQPVKETQDKQISLWGALILGYCRHHKIFQLAVDNDELPLFCNTKVNRKLPWDARTLFLDALVKTGHGEWLSKDKKSCLILWKTKTQWADAIYGFIQSYGMQGSVMAVEEISSGDDTRGTELEGLDKEVIYRAVAILEDQGKARLFKGESEGEDGVKFF